MNRLSKISFEGYEAEYGYDASGKLTREERGGITTEYSYNSSGWLTEKKNITADKTETYSLTYYSDGNIASKSENGFEIGYSYDELGQLIQEGDTQYTYDTRGNRMTKVESGRVKESYSYDIENMLRYKETEDEYMLYEYDKNGNSVWQEVRAKSGAEELLSRIDMSYDNLNRMTKTEKDGMTAEYSYGIDNMRRSKTVNGTAKNYLWDGGNIVGETDSEGNITAKYYHGSGITAADMGNGIQWYLSDSHGDITEFNGTEYSYDAFGNQYMV